MDLSKAHCIYLTSLIRLVLNSTGQVFVMFSMYSVYYLCQKQKCIILHNVSYVDTVNKSKFM